MTSYKQNGDAVKVPTGIGEHFPVGSSADLYYQVRDAGDGDYTGSVEGKVVKANYAGVTIKTPSGSLRFVGAPFVVSGEVYA